MNPGIWAHWSTNRDFNNPEYYNYRNIEMPESVSTVLKTIGKVIGISLGVIGLLTTFYYVIIDRSNVIAQVNDNAKDIISIRLDVEELKNQKNSLNDLKYNVKRLMEKQGIKWEDFNK